MSKSAFSHLSLTAAERALKPTTEWLQTSAQQLVIRMCELRADERSAA